jgi:hypothetical protein
MATVSVGVSVSVKACRHKGHVDFVLDQVARHPKWKACPHEVVAELVPVSIAARQMEQSMGILGPSGWSTHPFYEVKG